MCSKSELQHILNKTAVGLADIFGDRLENVLLYGYARGKQVEESNIDVMALVNLPRPELNQYRRRVSDFSSEIDLQHDVLLSIKLQDTESFHQYADTLPFCKNVIRELVLCRCRLSRAGEYLNNA